VGALRPHWRGPGRKLQRQPPLREATPPQGGEQRASLDRQHIDIVLDDTTVEFVAISDGEAWSAYGEHGDTTITIVARRFPIEAVEFESTDVEAYVKGSSL